MKIESDKEEQKRDGVNHFIASTAKDFDMSYAAVEFYYNGYGSTPEFYDKLEEHIKMRSF